MWPNHPGEVRHHAMYQCSFGMFFKVKMKLLVPCRERLAAGTYHPTIACLPATISETVRRRRGISVGAPNDDIETLTYNNNKNLGRLICTDSVVEGNVSDTLSRSRWRPVGYTCRVVEPPITSSKPPTRQILTPALAAFRTKK